MKNMAQSRNDADVTSDFNTEETCTVSFSFSLRVCYNVLRYRHCFEVYHVMYMVLSHYELIRSLLPFHSVCIKDVLAS